MADAGASGDLREPTRLLVLWGEGADGDGPNAIAFSEMHGRAPGPPVHAARRASSLRIDRQRGQALLDSLAGVSAGGAVAREHAGALGRWTSSAPRSTCWPASTAAGRTRHDQSRGPGPPSSAPSSAHSAGPTTPAARAWSATPSTTGSSTRLREVEDRWPDLRTPDSPDPARRRGAPGGVRQGRAPGPALVARQRVQRRRPPRLGRPRVQGARRRPRRGRGGRSLSPSSRSTGSRSR